MLQRRTQLFKLATGELVTVGYRRMTAVGKLRPNAGTGDWKSAGSIANLNLDNTVRTRKIRIPIATIWRSEKISELVTVSRQHDIAEHRGCTGQTVKLPHRSTRGITYPDTNHKVG